MSGGLLEFQFTTADFEGAWSVGRWIEDRRNERTFQFVGLATFAPGPDDALVYHEDGRLQAEGMDAIRAERRYIWRFGGADPIAVEFEDGRPFYAFDPLATRPRATHVCDPDTYVITLDFGDWPDWRTVWVVTGPKKDMTITTAYARK